MQFWNTQKLKCSPERGTAEDQFVDDLSSAVQGLAIDEEEKHDFMDLEDGEFEPPTSTSLHNVFPTESIYSKWSFRGERTNIFSFLAIITFEIDDVLDADDESDCESERNLEGHLRSLLYFCDLNNVARSLGFEGSDTEYDAVNVRPHRSRGVIISSPEDSNGTQANLNCEQY